MNAAAWPLRRGDPRRLLAALASLRLTLVLLAWLALAVVWAYYREDGRMVVLALPLAALALNLAAAVLTRPALYRNGPLLVFHLSLLALVALAALGRASYLTGRVELAEGVPFTPAALEAARGPWHGGRLEDVRFVQHGFDIDYAAGMQRGATRNRVRYVDAAGAVQEDVIGDMRALQLHGYRFYTSPNKGFAPTFQWTVPGHEPVLGAVHLPSWPIHEYEQANQWQPDGAADALWVMLKIDEPIADAGGAWQFRLPQRHLLVVRAGDQRHELQPGQAVALAGGELHYLGLRRWMGYTVFYDWTLSWLLAAASLAALSLGWHYWRKFTARPWNAERPNTEARNEPSQNI